MAEDQFPGKVMKFAVDCIQKWTSKNIKSWFFSPREMLHNKCTGRTIFGPSFSFCADPTNSKLTCRCDVLRGLPKKNISPRDEEPKCLVVASLNENHHQRTLQHTKILAVKKSSYAWAELPWHVMEQGHLSAKDLHFDPDDNDHGRATHLGRPFLSRAAQNPLGPLSSSATRQGDVYGSGFSGTSHRHALSVPFSPRLWNACSHTRR